MVKLRLTRVGKKGEPHYRVIAIQAREKRESKAIEFLGYYDPKTNPSTFKVEKDRIQYWLSVGAQPTATVARLLARQELFKVEPKKFNKKPGKKIMERAEAEVEQEEKKK